MEKRYKIFSSGFNNTLDLVELYAHDIYKTYMSFIDLLDDKVVNAIINTDDFSTENDKYCVDFMEMFDDASIDYIRKDNCLIAEVYVHQLMEKELFTEGSHTRLFSIRSRNTAQKQKDLKFYYKQVGEGEYEYTGMNDDNLSKKDNLWEIVLHNDGDNYYLNVRKEFRGVEYFTDLIPIGFDELYEFVEEEYEEDDEFNID